jgi:hypothetical protein
VIRNWTLPGFCPNTRNKLFGAFFFFTTRGTRIYICPMYVAPAVAPLENMLVVPGGASVGDMATCCRDICSGSPSRAPTYSCCCSAGSLWDATDRVPIVGTFLLAARGSRIGLDCSARAIWGQSLVRATTIACMFRRPWMARSSGKAAVAASLHPFESTR